MDVMSFFITPIVLLLLPLIVHGVFMPYLFYIAGKQKRDEFPPSIIQIWQPEFCLADRKPEKVFSDIPRLSFSRQVSCAKSSKQKCSFAWCTMSYATRCTLDY